MPDFEKELKRPFSLTEIEWRVERAGNTNGKTWAMVLAYIDNRAIMDRLDAVCGIEGWKNEFVPLADGAFLCGLSIKFENEWIMKWDGADKTQYESLKGGISGAQKRAAVNWGIGRYLYALKETWAIINPNGSRKDSYLDKGSQKRVYFAWDPPPLPDWACPDNRPVAATQTEIEDFEKMIFVRDLPQEARDFIQKEIAVGVTVERLVYFRKKSLCYPLRK